MLFYQPGYYLANPLDILKIWQGGMSFHGGFTGVAVAVLVFCLRQKVPLLGTADLLALATPPGLFLGQLADFTNNELWGRPTDVPWAVNLPGEAAQAVKASPGSLPDIHLRLYEAFLEGVLLGTLLLYLVWRRGWLQDPGALTGVFLIGYGLARGFVELFRQPDMQFVTAENPIGHALHFGEWGLTMGQVLSAPMIVTGLAQIFYSLSHFGSAADQRPNTVV